jgi:regulator of RNase E activity RraA
VQVEAIGGAVNIGDARCEAGDILRGDSDGVVVIPKAHEEEVLTVAEEIDAIEQRIRDAVKTGRTLVEARKQHGYHTLQTRKK